MRTLATALLVLAAACATGRPGDAPSIAGTYVLTRIDSRTLPTYSPSERNVIVQRGTLNLGRAGAFVLTLAARSSPQLPLVERSVRGAYAVSGETLTVTPGSDAPGAAPIVYRVARAGIQLTLRDAQGHRYEFTVR